eukprot:3911246-Rhodomonas_salina.1
MPAAARIPRVRALPFVPLINLHHQLMYPRVSISLGHGLHCFRGGKQLDRSVTYSNFRITKVQPFTNSARAGPRVSSLVKISLLSSSEPCF